MAVFLAYFLVVLIWATTPLAIQWSSDSVNFLVAVVLRMALALSIMLVITAVFRRTLFSHAQAWKVYLAASIGIFPNMPLVYWAAQFIPSGLVALIFAMSPFVTGAMTLLILRENPFNRRRVFSLLLALAGLIIIFHSQWQLDVRAAIGVAGVFGSSVLFSFSSVLLKSLKPDVPAFDQATGSLLFAMPGLLLVWWLFDGSIPVAVSTKSGSAIIYLAVMGSILGFTLFFYVLTKMSPSAVSLITLQTPVLALLLGALVADEDLTASIVTGATLVLVALLFYNDWSFGRWFEDSLRRGAQFDSSLAEIRQRVDRYK